MTMTSAARDLQVDQRDDGVVLVTLNRPQSRNTVSFAMWEAFDDLISRIGRDTPPRALVLRGADGWFSSGGDIKNPPARGEGALNRAARLELGQQVIRRLAALPVPTIAAVEGGAWGVSWGLALACDMLIAGQNATFGAPFVRFGLAPDGGVAWFLTRQIGRRRAAEILFSGRTVTASEALDMGLASRVVADDQVVAEALSLAAGLGEGNRRACELTKRLIHMADENGLEGTLALELAYCHQLQTGDEALRARQAFVDRAAAKRKA